VAPSPTNASARHPLPGPRRARAFSGSLRPERRPAVGAVRDADLFPRSPCFLFAPPFFVFPFPFPSFLPIPALLEISVPSASAPFCGSRRGILQHRRRRAISRSPAPGAFVAPRALTAMFDCVRLHVPLLCQPSRPPRAEERCARRQPSFRPPSVVPSLVVFCPDSCRGDHLLRLHSACPWPRLALSGLECRARSFPAGQGERLFFPRTAQGCGEDILHYALRQRAI